MLKQYNIAIILNGAIWAMVSCLASNESKAYDQCFEYADQQFGTNDFTNEIELYDLNNPRHKILFADVKIA